MRSNRFPQWVLGVVAGVAGCMTPGRTYLEPPGFSRTFQQSHRPIVPASAVSGLGESAAAPRTVLRIPGTAEPSVAVSPPTPRARPGIVVPRYPTPTATNPGQGTGSAYR